MKKFLLIHVFIVICSFCFSQQESKPTLYMDIYFGGGFVGGDFLTMEIDGSRIYERYGIYSIPNLALANGSIKVLRDDTQLFWINSEDQVGKLNVDAKDTYTIMIYLRGQVQEVELNLERGKYVIISIDKDEKVELSQLDHIPQFE